MNFTANSFNHQLSACGEVDPDLCNPTLECFQGAGSGQFIKKISPGIYQLNGSLSGIFLNVDSQILFDQDVLQADVYNVIGEIVLKSAKISLMQPYYSSLDLEKLASGIYFVVLKTKSGPIAIKWVKE